MGLNISFFKTPEHRVFHYTPRFYDEAKERMEERYEKYGKTPDTSKANCDSSNDITLNNGETSVRENFKTKYIPGRNIRGAYRKSLDENRRSAGNGKTKKIIGYITILAAMVAAYYLAEGFVNLLR